MILRTNSSPAARRTALITGGDSGIGRAVAVLFAREGADIDAEVTKEAVEKEGRRCILMAGDVADAKFCRRAVQRALLDYSMTKGGGGY